MNNYSIQLNSDKNTITIKYYDLIDNRTLFKSLEQLIDIGMLDRVTVVLDFNEVKTLLVSYRQIINFRVGLSVLPAKKIHKIAVLNHCNNTVIDTICSSTNIVEDYVMKADVQCFKGNNGDYLYQWEAGFAQN